MKTYPIDINFYTTKERPLRWSDGVPAVLAPTAAQSCITAAVLVSDLRNVHLRLSLHVPFYNLSQRSSWYPLQKLIVQKESWPGDDPTLTRGGRSEICGDIFLKSIFAVCKPQTQLVSEAEGGLTNTGARATAWRDACNNDISSQINSIPIGHYSELKKIRD